MKAEELLLAIKVYGLSIRQVPHVVINRYTSSGPLPKGDQLVRVRWAPGEDYDRLKRLLDKPPNRADNAFTFEFDDDKRTVHRYMGMHTKVPEYAGWWMCQQVSNTDTRTQWSYKHDNLAPTLEESVRLFLSKLK